ncbi:enoyl-CoA hydratase-related protein [Microbacterium pygmaeum]|uniref:Naphthoate synthase n=1 Tax=Microbacterium pygmaeum TaxID=370764 RepID=A0A1G7XER3_9MICO|nr:enoyl-CoA hydratase-related protein [Microbacterium pygmaeum]SDG82712.1 naphthoate synthase [Microbacterium pygmaeum]
MSDYEDLLVTREGAVLTIAINRTDAGNKLRAKTCYEIVDAIRELKMDPTLRAAILTGVGEKFFCIGGEHDETVTVDPSQVIPIVDVYQAIDTVPKPVIAAVNGFAVGGGNVLANVCDLTIAADSAVFRQVGPMVGSFDAGYGTWYLEDSIGRKRAKELWYLNDKYSAQEALEIGLVNKVVPLADLRTAAAELAARIATRSPIAIGALKGAFSARHNGVSGQSRLAHDQHLTLYLTTQEAHETSAAFTERRDPDPEKFWK